MGLFKKKPPTPEQIAAEEAKSFFDCICPSTVKFFPHHYMEAVRMPKMTIRSRCIFVKATP